MVITIWHRTVKMMSVHTLLVLSCVLAAVAGEEKYTDKYDNINLKEILENKRLLHSYVDCLLDKGRCTAEGKELKEHFTDALETGCAKCTESQRNGTYIVIEHIISKEQPLWKELTEKYDPEGTWRKKYEAEAKEHGIKIPE